MRLENNLFFADKNRTLKLEKVNNYYKIKKPPETRSTLRWLLLLNTSNLNKENCGSGCNTTGLVQCWVLFRIHVSLVFETV